MMRTLKDYRPQHDNECAKITTCRWCSISEAHHSNMHVFEPARNYKRTPAPDSVVACTCGLDALLAECAPAAPPLDAQLIRRHRPAAAPPETTEPLSPLAQAIRDDRLRNRKPATPSAPSPSDVEQALEAHNEAVRELVMRVRHDAHISVEDEAWVMVRRTRDALIAAVRQEQAAEIERLKELVVLWENGTAHQRERAEAAEAEVTRLSSLLAQRENQEPTP